GLDVVRDEEVVIVSRNCRKLPIIKQTRDCLGKGVTEIRILGAAAVPSPPTGIHGELHEVCETSDLLCPCRFTARQSAKLIQVDWIGALRNQVRVNESEVAHLILGIVVDVLVHASIENLKGRRVDCTPAAPWDFAVL